MRPDFTKLCNTCGVTHDAAHWRTLVCVGVQHDEDDLPRFVCRDCSCGSTLLVPIEEEGDTIVIGTDHYNRFSGTEQLDEHPVPPPYRRSTTLVCAHEDAELYAVALDAVGYNFVEAWPVR